MKKITLLFASLLCVAYIAVAQLKLYVYQNDGTRTEFVASTVDSIAFSTITDSPDQPDDPIKPVEPINGYEYVDLGLPSGTKWAIMNVGADSPEDYGDYFAWGETTPKSRYNWSTYKWRTSGMPSWNGVNKYTIADGQTSGVWYNSYGNFIGDNKTTLDLSDDAAYVNWGSSWRMPTKAEQNELRNTSYTTWTWTTQNGVNGYKVTSKTNGNSIFLPAAGYRNNSDLRDAGYYGYYWSSSLYTYSSDRAYYLYFNSGIVGSYDDYRNYGRSVRPVLRVEFIISFDANGGTGTMSAMSYEEGETKVLTANKFTRTGYIFNGWNTKSDGTGTPYTDKQSITPTENLTLYAQWEEYKGIGTANGYAWVDLGLPSGTKWATMNVGADSPEDYGDYFAWGETTTKSSYTSSNYTYSGTSTTLQLSRDAAYVNWGSSWRMPKDAEFKELKDNCIWTWTIQNGVNGYKVTSKANGNSIFLPAAGYRVNSGLNYKGSYGRYWSSSLYKNSSYYAYYLNFYSDDVDSSYDYRYYGRSVRPVLRDVELTFTIMFDSNGGEGTMPAIDGQHDDRMKIPASTFTREGYYFASWNTKADGTGTSYKVGEVITQTEDLILYAQWEESKDTGTANGHDWVELGLPSGTKWATMNVGADSPEEYGDYFAWGETTPKSTYSWSSYKWMTSGMSSRNGVNKYTIADGQTSGVWYSNGNFIGDNKTTLDLADDAANANWGGNWRMPTKTEQDELKNTNYTTWTWTTQNGVEGYKVTSKSNGNSIFLPAAGYRDFSGLSNAGSYGYYWSSSLGTLYSYDAYYLRFDSSGVGWSNDRRYNGRSVRPVLAE